MADSEAGPSNIFRSLMGKISEHQWETYKEMKLGQSDLVLTDSDEDDSAEEVDDSACFPPSTMDVEMDIEKDENISDTSCQEKLNAESDDCDERDIPSTMTTNLMKYINGEMSFNEISDILGQTDEQAITIEKGKQVADTRDSGTEAEKEFEQELENQKKKRRRGKLPKFLQGLMGEANLCFARGDHEDAIKMCFEIIRQAPHAPEPFQTLGMLYEELGDMEKSFQFFLIGAHLNPNDPEEWSKLAEMALENNDVKQAVQCYSNAIKYDPGNIGLIWQRCLLYEQEGDRKKALMGYEAIMQHLQPEQGIQCIELSREIAKIHHEKRDIPAAIQVMEKAFHKFSSLITSEDVNLLVEMQISQQRYSDALDILRRHCGVILTNKDGNEENDIENGLKNVEKCCAPDALPIDLQVKLIVCLIHLNALHLIQNLWVPLQQENVEEVGDLYLDVAESYMQMKAFPPAIAILFQLVQSENYNMAAVWLRYAECLSAIGELEKATEMYKKVVEMAPCHSAARLSLSSLLQQSGKTQEAITALKQSYEKGQKDAALDLELLLERCNLLYCQKLWDEFIKCGELVLSSNFRALHTPAEFRAVCNNKEFRKTDTLKDNAQTEDSNTATSQPKFTDSTISSEELWKLYLKMWQTLYDLRRFKELQSLSLRALTSSAFLKNANRAKDAEFLALLGCFYNKNHRYSYYLIRDILLKNMHKNNPWNLFSQIVALGEDIRHVRFCLRLMFKERDHLALQFLNGHTALVAGSYKHALGEYMAIFKKIPDDPLVVLHIALTFIHIACQKFTARRHCLVIQGIAFLTRYYELRGECQESLYNIGRALHQLGLCTSAIHYYKRALACPVPYGLEGEQEIFDLSHEISYNLALIYQASGATTLAKMYLNRY